MTCSIDTRFLENEGQKRFAAGNTADGEILLRAAIIASEVNASSSILQLSRNLFLLAYAYHTSGQLSAADKLYVRCAKLNAMVPVADQASIDHALHVFSNRSDIMLQRKKFDKAEAFALEGIRLAGSEYDKYPQAAALLFCNLGEAQAKQGDLAGAKTSYENGVSVLKSHSPEDAFLPVAQDELSKVNVQIEAVARAEIAKVRQNFVDQYKEQLDWYTTGVEIGLDDAGRACLWLGLMSQTEGSQKAFPAEFEGVKVAAGISRAVLQ